MRESIRRELTDYIKEYIQEHLEFHETYWLSSDDIHQAVFNTDVYITYYSEADKWLVLHDMSPYEAIEVVQEYEIEHFGESNTPLNSEAIVNTLVYIYGLELVGSTIEDLHKENLIIC